MASLAGRGKTKIRAPRRVSIAALSHAISTFALFLSVKQALDRPYCHNYLCFFPFKRHSLSLLTLLLKFTDIWRCD
jgi:hypothetical protein